MSAMKSQHFISPCLKCRWPIANQLLGAGQVYFSMCSLSFRNCLASKNGLDEWMMGWPVAGWSLPTGWMDGGYIDGEMSGCDGWMNRRMKVDRWRNVRMDG